ncbi:hypothetical protein [Rhodanobacter lindaniclasticus]
MPGKTRKHVLVGLATQMLGEQERQAGAGGQRVEERAYRVDAVERSTEQHDPTQRRTQLIQHHLVIRHEGLRCHRLLHRHQLQAHRRFQIDGDLFDIRRQEVPPPR